jgi:hypothetical protein
MKKAILKALILSGVVMLMSVSVLFTTAYAWFIDSESVTDNRIQAGTLEVSLTAYEKDGTPIDLSAAKIISETNWQPSDRNAKAFTITNNGSIDFRWTRYHCRMGPEQ